MEVARLPQTEGSLARSTTLSWYFEWCSVYRSKNSGAARAARCEPNKHSPDGLRRFRYLNRRSLNGIGGLRQIHHAFVELNRLSLTHHAAAIREARWENRSQHIRGLDIAPDFLHLQLFHLAIEIRAVQPKQSCGVGHVIVHLSDAAANEVPLKLASGFIQPQFQ